MSDEVTSTGTEAAAAEAPAAETTLVTAPAAEEGQANAETGNEAENTTETGSGEQAGVQVEGDKPEGEAAEGDKEGDKPGAPEEYAEFTMPEGIALDTDVADKFKGIAKDLNLTQDQAQKLVDVAAEMRQKDVEAIISLRQAWIDETKADPEIGGDKLDQTLGVAKKAITAYGSDQFIKLLNETGLGNHPEFVRFCARAGKAVAEDSSVVTSGDKTKTPNRTLAERLYGPTKE